MQLSTGTVSGKFSPDPHTYQGTEGKGQAATDPQRSAQKRQHEMQRKSQDKQKAPAVTPQITYARGGDC